MHLPSWLIRFLVMPLGAVLLLYVVVDVADPWAAHIGDRATPLFYWHGYGRLLSHDGHGYPLYVIFYPAGLFTHSDSQKQGLHASGDLQGSAALCASRGVIQRLNLTGTIYGAWNTTKGSLMDFRLIQPRAPDSGLQTAFFGLEGRWRGPDISMDHSADPGNEVPTALPIENATVTLDWGSYSEFESACAHASNLPEQ
jgi:hypothetical protein